MSVSNIDELACNFITAYLESIRYKASRIPKADHGLFPFYWYRSSKITIFKTLGDDLAISIDRVVSGKVDKITIRDSDVRIEETQFPNLDYITFPFFRIPRNGHDIVIRGGTVDLGSHPLIVLSDGAEVRIMKVRIEVNVKGYPREKELLWFFTSPNLTYLTPEKSNYESEIDFWGEIEWLVSTKLDILLSRNIAKETLSLFRTYLENLKREYQKLISRQDLDEPMLQQYLENHFFLLSPRFISKKEKRNLGPYTPDFILGCGGKKTLVEIQLNRDPIIKNGKPSEGFEEALKQLSDWLNWIESNEPATLPRFKGLIVIGRKENYLKHEKIIKNILSCNVKYSVNLLTYDDLVDSIDYILLRLSGNN